MAQCLIRSEMKKHHSHSTTTYRAVTKVHFSISAVT